MKTSRNLEELNTSTQLCSKTSSLGEDNIYADVSSLSATPSFVSECGK